MKIKWNPNLDYQNDAVNSVIDLFKGHFPRIQYFSLPSFTFLENTQCIGNMLDISPIEIEENLRNVQLNNCLCVTEDINSYDFDIIMSKGTGKTYVYLKTIFELNKHYNFNKFIIVVSNKFQLNYVSNFIKDTKNHFKELYDNVIYDNFIYDSSKLEQIRNFAVNSNIQIMIINIDSFNSKSNVIYKKNEKFRDCKPIDLISKINPIVIVDDSELIGKKYDSIYKLDPLFTLNYFSTLNNYNNLVYKLDFVDAVQKGLYKQIKLLSFEYPVFMEYIYIKLISIAHKKSFNTARIEINALVNGKLKRKEVTVKKGSDLSELKFSNLEVYENWIVNEINADEEYISFSQSDSILKVGHFIDEINNRYIKRFLIRKTIEEHLEKELLCDGKIKVLSVFLIDDFKKLMSSDDKNIMLQEYFKVFEEEFMNLINNTKFSQLEFSNNIKKYCKYVNSKDFINNLDINDSNCRFIFLNQELIQYFSNSNIFQICNLSDFQDASQINMGIQLCRDFNGNVIYDKNINKLSIITVESPKVFSKNLQKNIEDNHFINFGRIKENHFSRIIWMDGNGNKRVLDNYDSHIIFNHLLLNQYIDRYGRIQKKLIVAIKECTFEVPEKYENIKDLILERIRI